VPDAFLQPAPGEPIASQAAITASVSIPLAGQPQAIALAENQKLGLVLLADGHLEMIDLIARRAAGTVWVGDNPQAGTVATTPARAYISLDNGLAAVDLNSRTLAGSVTGLGQLRDLAWDTVTRRLFVAEAEHNQLLVFGEDLTGPAASLFLPHQPDQVVIDSLARRIYLSFPAAAQVMAVNIDDLTIDSVASLTGGPILKMVLDSSHRRLYVLSALAPTYRGLTVLDTPGLNQLAVVAGAGDFPLRTATSLALTPAGQLVVAETGGLWQIKPDDFTVKQIYSTLPTAPAVELVIQRNDGTIFTLEPLAHLLKVY
jgi:hypothetical protein